MDCVTICRNKLIMVMGMQRSGTTALLYALGQDPSVQIENEEPEGPLYNQYRLRPAHEMHPELMRIKRRVILKPVVEAEYREIDDVIQEFLAYDPLIAWIYRDPIDVWSSAKRTFHLSPEDFSDWLNRWVKGNESALRSLSGRFRDRIRAVDFHDLIQHREVFNSLCEFLHLEPRNNLFWREDPKKGHRSLPEDLQDRIESETRSVIEKLHEHWIKPARELLHFESDSQPEKSLPCSSWGLRTHYGAVAKMTSIPDRGGTRFSIERLDGTQGLACSGGLAARQRRRESSLHCLVLDPIRSASHHPDHFGTESQALEKAGICPDHQSNQGMATHRHRILVRSRGTGRLLDI